MTRYIIQFFIALYFCLNTHSAGSTPFILSEELNGKDLSKNSITWLGSPTLNLKDPCFQSPSCPDSENRPVKLRRGFGGPVIGQQSLYLKNILVNPDSENRKVIITADWMTSKDMYIFQSQGKSSIMKHSSKSTPPKFREVATSLLNIELTIPPGETTLITRIDNLDFHKAIIKIWDPASLDDHLNYSRLFLWTIYGMLGALILIFFSIFLTSKDFSFFWAVISQLSLIVFDLHSRDYNLELLNVLGFNVTYPPFEVMIVSGSMALFGFYNIVDFLHDVKERNPRFSRILNLMTYGLLSFIPILLVLDFRHSLNILTIANLAAHPLIAYYAVWLISERIVPAYLPILTWCPFAIAYYLYLAQMFGYIETNLFFQTALVWGFTLLMIALGLTLGHKTLALNRDKTTSILKEEDMKSTLEVARVVQESLLPKSKIEGFHIFQYYHPAESIGGDSYFYDSHKNFIFMAIFDVTGHGISSAIMTGTITGVLKKAFQYEAQLFTSSRSLIETLAMKLNVAILEFNENSKGHLVTMACGLLDTKTSCFHYLSAGHIASYLIKSNEVVTMISKGSPLGLRKDPIFHIKEWIIESGDKILFMTDGILENLTQQGNYIKEPHVLKKLKQLSNEDVTAIGDWLKEYLTSSFQNIELADDMTFLMIGRDQAAEEPASPPLSYTVAAS